VEPTAATGTAAMMADAVSYLCRVAAEEGLYAVLHDLLEVQHKLESIASAQDCSAGRLN
jgi:hypothetical protein